MMFLLWIEQFSSFMLYHIKTRVFYWRTRTFFFKKKKNRILVPVPISYRVASTVPVPMQHMLTLRKQWSHPFPFSVFHCGFLTHVIEDLSCLNTLWSPFRRGKKMLWSRKHRVERACLIHKKATLTL